MEKAKHPAEVFRHQQRQKELKKIKQQRREKREKSAKDKEKPPVQNTTQKTVKPQIGAEMPPPPALKQQTSVITGINKIQPSTYPPTTQIPSYASNQMPQLFPPVMMPPQPYQGFILPQLPQQSGLLQYPHNASIVQPYLIPVIYPMNQNSNYNQYNNISNNYSGSSLLPQPGSLLPIPIPSQSNYFNHHLHQSNYIIPPPPPPDSPPPDEDDEDEDIKNQLLNINRGKGLLQDPNVGLLQNPDISNKQDINKDMQQEQNRIIQLDSDTPEDNNQLIQEKEQKVEWKKIIEEDNTNKEDNNKENVNKEEEIDNQLIFNQAQSEQRIQTINTEDNNKSVQNKIRKKKKKKKKINITNFNEGNIGSKRRRLNEDESELNEIIEEKHIQDFGIMDYGDSDDEDDTNINKRNNMNENKNNENDNKLKGQIDQHEIESEYESYYEDEDGNQISEEDNYIQSKDPPIQRNLLEHPFYTSFDNQPHDDNKKEDISDVSQQYDQDNQDEERSNERRIQREKKKSQLKESVSWLQFGIMNDEIFSTPVKRSREQLNEQHHPTFVAHTKIQLKPSIEDTNIDNKTNIDNLKKTQLINAPISIDKKNLFVPRALMKQKK
ncbi:MAG: hypothetical protein EZS28_002800 [Streblomastix strix]|uniref:Uncharacterized protein n=1 Tax=Streblomastix strix TaxID=222440 RepID=A0A5J4X4F7_9EUKA|nr:MAG: hypothetical protein EZS28_002800 [Streblomastix strix]